MYKIEVLNIKINNKIVLKLIDIRFSS